MQFVQGQLISVWSHLHQIGYREKAREEASRGGSLAHRPDIALATKVSGLTSQVQRTISTICPYSYHLLENVSFTYFTFKMAGISHWKPFLHHPDTQISFHELIFADWYHCGRCLAAVL